MKKITLLLLFLCTVFSGNAQCIRTFKYPGQTVTSNNQGFPQEIEECNYTLNDYAQVSNITIGSNYIFTCTYEGNEKYITVTDTDNNVIAYGESPLTVEAITADEIRLHYSDNAACDGVEGDCHITTLQIVLTCPIPVNPSVSNVTTTSADFSWEAAGTETAWEVLVQPASASAPDSNDSGTAVTSLLYTTASLTPSTAYEFYVRANCGSEFSPWSLPLNFNTACNAIGSFNENFDSADNPDLPNCWNTLLRGSGLSQDAYIQNVDYGNVYSEPNSVEIFNADSTLDSDIILVSPNLSNLGAGTHRMKFYARGYSNLQIGTLDGFSDSATFNLLEEVTVSETTTQYTVDFTSYTGTDTYIGIRLNPSDIYAGTYVDNILWEQSPTCPDVTEVSVAAVGTDNVTVNWLAGGTETAWEVAVGAASVNDPNTLTPVSASTESKNVNGLTDATDYKVWVRSMCAGGTDAGVWIGPVSFTTACLPVANFYEDFDNTEIPELPGCWSTIFRGPTVSESASINTVTFNVVHSAPASVEMYNSDSDTAGADDIMLVSPNLSTVGAGTHRLKFYAKNAGSLQVGTLDTNTNTAVFNLIEEITTTPETAQYIVDFSSYTGTDSYVAIRFNNADTYTTIQLDDILWEVNPTCPDVSEVTVPVTTTSGATVTWVGSGAESLWNIAVGPASVSDPNTLAFVTSTEETKDISGLIDNTKYRVWVRSVCAGNDNGAWIGPVPFKTACLPTTSFYETFDTVEAPAIPDCWSTIFRGPTLSENAYIGTNEFNPVYSDPNSIELYNDNSNTATSDDVILVSPNLSTLSLGTYRLKFYAKNAGSLQIGTLDTNTDSAVFSFVEEVTTVDETTQYIIDFSSYTGSDTYIGIRLNNADSYTSVMLDNVVWEVNPTCPDVTEVNVTSVTTTTADAVWVANGSESQWQAAVTLFSESDPTTATPVNASNQYVTLNGLTAATEYNLWVRSVCAGNDYGAWIGPVKFTTACNAEPLADVDNQGFEDTDDGEIPVCWSITNLSGDSQWQTLTPSFGSINTTHSGDKIMFKSSQASDALLYSLPMNFTNISSATIDVWLHRHAFSDPADKYVIYVNNAPTLDGAEMVLEQFSVVDAQPVVGGMGFYNYQAEIPAVFCGQSTVYVIFEGFTVGGSFSGLGIDDFKIEFETLSTPGIGDDKFSYYPNPVKDFLTLTNSKEITSIAVYNMIGQQLILKNENSTTSKVDMSALPNGNYVVKVTADGMTKTVKVVKQ